MTVELFDLTLTAQSWTQRAACRDVDPEVFFPISEIGPGTRQVAEAKAVCARCPARADCLDFALTAGLDHGVFGGLTAAERRESRRGTATA